jgi:hypothetical protein
MELDPVSAFKITHMNYECECVPKCVHEHSNMRFEAGIATGHPTDTLYIKIEKPDDNYWTTILITPEEAISLIWVLTGAMSTDEIFNAEAGEPSS